MHALLVVALLFSQAPAPAPEAPEPFPFSAGLQPVYDQAFEALKGPSPRDAEADVKRLLEGAPENPRTWRLAGQLYFVQERNTDAMRALDKSLELGIDDTRRADVLTLLGIIHFKEERYSQADATLSRALQLDPENRLALYQSTLVALQRDKPSSAEGFARRLLQFESERGLAHGLLAVALANQERLQEAEQEMELARQSGADLPFFPEIEAAVDHARWIRLAWLVPLALIGSILATLLTVWIAGWVLSKLQLGQLSAEHIHLMKDEQRPWERLVDRLYSLVLWVASLLFYVSVPAMLLVTLAFLGAVLYAISQARVIHIKLVLIALLAGGGGLIAILRGLFARPPEEEEPRELTRDEAPGLFRALNEVAEVAKSRPVDRVLLVAGTEVGVREAGGRIRVLLGRGERILTLGLGALRGLSVSELKSILAHEYGHFSHGETRLTPIIARILGQVFQTLQAMAQLGQVTLLNPVWWFLKSYFFVYLRITSGHGRRRELLADRLAALAWGGDTFGRALSRVIENSDAFHRGMVVAASMREVGRPVDDLYRTIDAAARGMPAPLQALVRQELFARPVDAYDSHPPPSERVARVAGIPPQRRADEEPALSLFADPDALCREMGKAMLDRLDIALQMQGAPAAAPVPTTDEERDRLSEALALHRAAIALDERRHAEAYPLLQESVARLEAITGDKDPMLVPALAELSRAHVRHNAPEAARHVLTQALGIVQSRPQPDPAHLAALNAMLGELPRQQAA